jgi:hypothetical protein
MKTFPLYCCIMLYIVAFTKVLSMYQIYYTWIYSLHHSPLSTPPLIPGIVSTGTIFAFTDMCTHILHHIHPPTLFPCHLPANRYHPSHTPNLFPPSWLSNFEEEKREKIRKTESYREYRDISMHTCIITPIGLSPLIFFILP